jgi:hypothetical protein
VGVTTLEPIATRAKIQRTCASVLPVCGLSQWSVPPQEGEDAAQSLALGVAEPRSVALALQCEVQRHARPAQIPRSGDAAPGRQHVALAGCRSVACDVEGVLYVCCWRCAGSIIVGAAALCPPSLKHGAWARHAGGRFPAQWQSKATPAPFAPAQLTCSSDALARHALADFAIDAQTAANGALTVLNGSHELGRLDHCWQCGIFTGMGPGG